MRAKHAFTLVELLVVIAILSILAALLLPPLEAGILHARAVACANNHRQRNFVLMGYFYDSNYTWPDFYPRGASGYYGDSKTDAYGQYYAVAGQPAPPRGHTVYYNYGVLFHMGYFSEPQLIEDPDFTNAPGFSDTLANAHVSRTGNNIRDKKWPELTSGDGRGVANRGGYGSYPALDARATQAMKTGYLRNTYTWNYSISAPARIQAKRKTNPVIAMCMTGVPMTNFGAHRNRLTNATRSDGSVGTVQGLDEYLREYRMRNIHPNDGSMSNGISFNTYTYWYGHPHIWDWADYKLNVPVVK